MQCSVGRPIGGKNMAYVENVLYCQLKINHDSYNKILVFEALQY